MNENVIESSFLGGIFPIFVTIKLGDILSQLEGNNSDSITVDPLDTS